MSSVLFEQGRILDPERTNSEPREGAPADPFLDWLLVEDGCIAAAGRGTAPACPAALRVALGGDFLAPGFLDLHFHGELIHARAGEFDAALERTGAALLRAGTTGYLATTVAFEPKRLTEFVTQVASSAASPLRHDALAECIGVHLEGPWIQPDKAGAQPAASIRPYDSAESRELIASAEGALAMVTLAPEIPGGLQAVADLRDAGLTVALGHSRAASETIDDAVAMGMTHVTHLFNAMTQAHHRELGVAGCALTDDRLTADLICDGEHVHPRMIRLAARAKPGALCLISDQVAPAPLRPGAQDEAVRGLGDHELRRVGDAWVQADGRLAGSALSLDHAVKRFVEFAGATLVEAVAAATLRPAKVLGVEAQRGTLRRGARADLVVLGGDLAVKETWLAGRRAFRGSAS